MSTYVYGDKQITIFILKNCCWSLHVKHRLKFQNCCHIPQVGVIVRYTDCMLIFSACCYITLSNSGCLKSTELSYNLANREQLENWEAISLEEKTVPGHGVDDPGHGEHGTKEGHSEGTYSPYGYHPLGPWCPVLYKHVDEGRVAVDVHIWNHQGENHRHTDVGG